MKSKLNNLLSSKILLIFIFTTALVLRTYNLSEVPYGFHFDEAQAAYNGFLISKHVKNISGQFLPTDIDYFGDYRPAVHSYLIAPAVKIAGNTVPAARLPSAIIGSFTVLLLYFLIQPVFNKKVALVASGLLAISPYHIIFSRATTDSIIEMFFVLLSFLLLLRFFKSQNYYLLPIVYVLWLLSFFTYQISRLLIPILTILFIISLFKKKFKANIKLSFVTLTLIIFMVFPVMLYSVNNKSVGRFSQVSTFSFPEVQRSINQQIMEAGTKNINPLFTRLFHNKLTGYSNDILKRYTSFFSPQILLFDDIRPIRYKVTSVGLVTPIEFIFFIMGVFFILQRKIYKSTFFLLALLAAPLPSALTFDDFPNFQRAIYLIPFLEIICAVGLVIFFKRIKNNIYALGLITLMTIFFLGNFNFQYFLLSPLHEPFYRNTDDLQISAYLNKEKKTHKKVALSSQSGQYVYYLYFNSLDIFNLPYEKTGKYFNQNFQIENIFFTSDKCIDELDSIYYEYDLVVNAGECKDLHSYNVSEEFRYTDKSLAAKSYEKDTDKSALFAKENSELIKCIRERGIENKITCLTTYPLTNAI